MAAHNTDRKHPMGSDQPSDRLGVGRRGGRLVTVKEHRGVLLGVCPRPAPPGAGARCRNAPLRVSRDTSRFSEGVERHVASVPPAPDGTRPETERFRDGSASTGRRAQSCAQPLRGSYGFSSPAVAGPRPLSVRSRTPEIVLGDLMVKGGGLLTQCTLPTPRICSSASLPHTHTCTGIKRRRSCAVRRARRPARGLGHRVCGVRGPRLAGWRAG